MLQEIQEHCCSQACQGTVSLNAGYYISSLICLRHGIMSIFCVSSVDMYMLKMYDQGSSRERN